jgi:hypothetical protein
MITSYYIMQKVQKLQGIKEGANTAVAYVCVECVTCAVAELRVNLKGWHLPCWRVIFANYVLSCVAGIEWFVCFFTKPAIKHNVLSRDQNTVTEIEHQQQF